MTHVKVVESCKKYGDDPDVVSKETWDRHKLSVDEDLLKVYVYHNCTDDKGARPLDNTLSLNHCENSTHDRKGHSLLVNGRCHE